MANPYIDTQLIECNRRQSTQKEQVDKLESNALYTNRVGDAILLKSGDTIQVQSAFINQKGCNIPTSLEFKGALLTNVKLNKTIPTTLITNVKTNVMGYESHSQYPEINNEVVAEVFDNKATLEVSYYKTSNGEQYTFLPRQFLVDDSDLTASNVNATLVWNKFLKNNNQTDDGVVVGSKSGICYYTPKATDIDLYNMNDYHLVADKAGSGTDNINFIRPKNDNSKYTLFTRCYNWGSSTTLDGIQYTDPSDPDPFTVNGLSYIIACTTGDLSTMPAVLKRYLVDLTTPTFDPALTYYTQQIDNVDISVKKGFNSAQSVAEQITEDLQKYIETETEGAFYLNTTNNTAITSSTTTNLLRPRLCGNPRTFGKSYYGWGSSDEKALDYCNCYKHILVKRPDLFIAGRQINNRLGQIPFTLATNIPLTAENTDTIVGNDEMKSNFIRNDINRDGTTNTNWTDPIVTSYVWNRDTLEKLSELFKIQGKYPELFKVEEGSGDLIDSLNAVFNSTKMSGGLQIPTTTNTIKNSRFLHMSRINYAPTTNAKLGSDDYTERTNTIIGVSQDVSHISAPIFFKYDDSKEDLFTDGNSIDDLCFGFATKTYLVSTLGNRTPFITLHPELVGGIPSRFFLNRDGKATPGNIQKDTSTIIGWDYHFNSYGNVVMLANTGMLPQSPNTEWGLNGGDFSTNPLTTAPTVVDFTNKYSQTYLGSNNTACVYDTVSNKFGWEYLHIPENVGQLYNSGESEVINKEQAGSTRLPLIDDAKNEVYKINKRLQYWSFCPDMKPYKNADDGDIHTGTDALTNGGATFAASGAMELSLFNFNLEPWSVFDAHTGVNLNFGKCCDKLNWNNSLLGIMGFTFEQFNPKTITSDNDGTQTRLTFNNNSSIYNPTTNSEVVSSDIKDYVTTPYGATQYYPQPALALGITEFNSNTAGTPTYKNVLYYPAIVEATQSIILEAVNLPTTVLNPYLNIRSDIISDSKYFGGLNSGLNYPIVAVVNKINADKDFIQLDGSDIIFTVKKDMALSSITTVITDPDGSLALIDEGSSVIYKIQRQKNGLDLNILQQIMEGEMKKKK